ncbi:MAG TPA: hypothetical protein VNF04_01410 [Stellaceae bacterium]|nr:hypothetical protein [Stellaceae bacterium]
MTFNDRQKNLLSVLEALADCKELKPGIVTRAVLAAVAKVPTLTPEFVAEPRAAALATRLELTPMMLARGRRAARGPSTPEMDALVHLGTVAKHTTLTPEFVVKSLLAKPGKDVLAALALHASKLGQKGAAARHAPALAKRDQIRAIWATGKFRTKALCAEEEYAALGMSPDTARKALKGVANPDPWPGKAKTPPV